MWNPFKSFFKATKNNDKKVGGKGESETDINRLPDELQWSLLFAILVIIAYSTSIYSWEIFSRLAISALATFLSGWFAGFLFGIPRTLPHTLQSRIESLNRKYSTTSQQATVESSQSPEPNAKLSDSPFSVNTNLEDISDWLTKIIVGVTLTQIGPIKDNLNIIVNFLAGDLPPNLPSNALFTINNFKGFILAVLVYFFVIGFIFGYLWARFNFANISQLIEHQTKTQLQLISSQLSKQSSQLSEQIETQNRKEEIAAKLQRLVNQQYTVKEPSIDSEELRKTIQEVSPIMRTFIAAEAIKTRKQAWKEMNKALMARTIPVLEALIYASPDTEKEKYDQTYAELGFALKEKEPPDYVQAKNLINKAIEIRGPWNREKGQYKAYYELNLAQCMIKLQDTEKDLIAQNLKVAKDAELLTSETIQENANESIRNWLANNRNWLEVNNDRYSLVELCQ